MLAGDAFGFLDPIYSTGVFLRPQVGRAGRRLDSPRRSKKTQDYLGSRSSADMASDYVAGMEAMRKLVYAYYDPSFSFQQVS